MITDTKLQGIDDIAGFAGRNWRTIVELKKKHGFPVVKIMGRWESDKILITNWRRKMVAQGAAL